MRKILMILFLLVGFASYSQVKQSYNQYGGRWLRSDDSLATRIPRKAVSVKNLNISSMDTAQIYYEPSDSSFNYHTGFQWLKLIPGSGGGGNGIVELGDTGNWGLVRINDSTYRADSLLLVQWGRLYKVNDSMKAVYDATFTPLSRQVNTGFGLTGGGDLSTNRTIIGDSTSGGFLSWVRGQKIADSLGALIGGVGTNIYNSNGTLEANRTVTGLNHTYSLTFDSLNSFVVRRNNTVRFEVTSAISRLFSPDQTSLISLSNGEAGLWNDNSNVVVHQDDSIIFNSVGGTYQFRHVPTGPGISALRMDANGKIFRADTTVGGGSYTDEQAQDAVGSILNTNTFNYDDATPAITLKTQMSITSDASGIKLSGDETTPSDGKFYGKRSGTKQWDFPVSLTTTGTSGAATLNQATGVLNVPNYSSGSMTWNGVMGSVSILGNNVVMAGSNQYVYTGIGGHTFTLPAIATNSRVYFVKNRGTGNLTVDGDGTEELYTTSAVANITIQPGESRILVADGTYWDVYDMEPAGGGFTQEEIEDFTGALFAPDNGDIDFTYNDGTPDIAATIKNGVVSNSKLANSTISGISLGSNLNDLTVDYGLAYNSGTTYNGGTAKTILVDTATSIQPKLVFEESVIKSNDSVFLRGEKALPVADATAYSKINNVQGFNPVAVINEVNPDEGHLLKYDSLSNQWTNFRGDSLIGFQYWRVGVDAGYPDDGDTEIIDSNFMGKNVAVYYDHQRLHPGLDYTHDPVVGEIQFNFTLQDSVPVAIETFSYLVSTILGRRTAVAPPTWEDIDYETNTNLSESPANQWQPTTGSGWGNTGLNDTKKLLTGTEGAIRIQRTAASQWYSGIGLDVSDTQEGFASWTAGALLIDLGGGVMTIYRLSGASSFDTGVTLAVGDWMAVWRYADGTTIIRKSTDGVNWSDVYSYGVVSTADLFLKCDLNYTGGGTQYGIMVNPQVLNGFDQ